jgi:hypothetical protein
LDLTTASTSSGNRDIIEYKRQDNQSLKGEYYIAISAYTYSYYSLYYFTSSSAAETESYIMSLGSIYTDSISKAVKKIYSFTSSMDNTTPHVVVLSSLNCDITFSRLDSAGTPTATLARQERASQEIRIKDSAADDFRYSYTINKMDSSADTNLCLVHLSANVVREELLLNEGIPHQVTLNEQLTSFNYIYPHVTRETGVVFSLFSDKGAGYNLNLYISFKGKVEGPDHKKMLVMYKGNQSHIFASKESLESSCPLYPCFIHLKLEIEKHGTELPLEDLTYKIIMTSNNNKPVYIDADKVTEGTQPAGVARFYRTDLSKGQTGEVSIHTKSGTIKAFAKIIAKDALPEPNSTYENVRLPYAENYQLKMDDHTGIIKFTEKHTSNCDAGCTMYISVYTEKYESFNDYLINYSITVRLSAVKLKLGHEHSGILSGSSMVNYYSVEIDKDTDELIIYTEHTNHIEMWINFGTDLPTENKNDWAVKFYSRDVEPNYKEKFVIKISEDILRSKGITNLKGQTFTIGLESIIDGDNFYSLFVVANDSQSVKKDPHILPYGSYTPCSTAIDDDFCLYVIYNIENEDDLLLYAKQSKIHNTGVKLSIYASVVSKSEYHQDNYPTKLGDFKYNSKGLVNTEFLILKGTELSDYKNKVIVVALHSTKQTSLTLFSSVHQMSLTILHTPIIGKPYLVFLEKMKKTEFQFSSDHYMVDVERIFGEGNFGLSGNRDYNFNISGHRPQYRLVLNTADRVSFQTDDKVAFFLVFRSKSDFYNIHIGKAYHFVILGASFPIDYKFPLLQDATNDNVFNIQIEKASPKFGEVKDVVLDLSYEEIGMGTNKTWTSDYVKSTQSGSLVFTNEKDHDDYESNLGYKNRTGIIRVKQIDDKADSTYDLLILNVILFPQNDGNLPLPKNKYINGKIINKEILGKGDYFNQHVYKLSRDHNKENFILVELSSCLGEIDFYIGEYINMQVHNVTKHEYKRRDSYGKSIIELNLNNNDADAFLIIYGKNPSYVDGQYVYSYVVRYNSYIDGNEYDTYNLAGQSLVAYSESDAQFELKWGSVTTKDDNNNDILLRSRYLVKLIGSDSYTDNINSICYTYGIEKYYRQKSSHIRDGDRIVISKNDLIDGQGYFVSIVATTDETSDHTMLAYNPVQLRNDSRIYGYPFWIIMALAFCTMVLILFLMILYKKYRSTKLRLDFEVNDVRGMSSVDRSENEMRSIQEIKGKPGRYMNLNESVVTKNMQP